MKCFECLAKSGVKSPLNAMLSHTITWYANGMELPIAKAPGSPAIDGNQLVLSAVRLKTIPGLDAVRAMSVVLVVLFHSWVLPSSCGELGVMSFFVLSGFLITRILLVEHAKTGTISLRHFYRNRVYRIMPTFYVCWLLETALFAYHKTPLKWWEPWLSFFYLTDYARAIAGEEAIKHLPVAWSLAVEEQFYLLWPAVLIWLLSRHMKAWRAVAIFVGCVWVHRMVLHAGFGVSYDYIYNAFDTRIDALMIGALMALLTVEASRNDRAARLLSSLTASPWLILPPLAGIILAAVLDPRIKPIPVVSMLTMSVQPILIAWVLIQTVCYGNVYWQFLANGAIRFVARISYALYLYHAVVFNEATRMTFPNSSGRFLGIRLLDVDHHPRMLFMIIPAVIIPIISYYAVERPFMRLRDRKRPEPVVAPPSPVAIG